MPTGPEHYQSAEEALARAGDTGGDHPAEQQFQLARAQAHATLALAAATALNGYDVDGMPMPEWGEWHQVTTRGKRR